MGLFTGQVRYAADFKESEHPRDHGRFATKEGGESSSSTATAEKPKQSGPKPILEEGSAVAKRARQNARAMLGKMKKGEIDAKDAKADNDIRRDKALADNRNNFAKRWRDLEGRVEAAYPPEAMDSDEWIAVKDSFRAAKDKVAGLIEKGSELVDAEIYWYAKGENKNVGKGTVEELDDLHNDIVSAYETGVNGIADALEAFFAKNGRKAYAAEGWPVRYGHSLFTGRVVRYSSMFEGVVRYAQRGLFDEEDHERGADGKFVEKGGDDLPSWQHGLANEYMEKSKRFVADRKELLTEARRTSKGLGYGDLRTVAARVSRTGMDEDSVKGLDDIAQLLGDKYKDHFGEEEPLRRLFEMLVEGDPKPISEDEAYEKAFDELEYAKGQEQPAQSDPDDVVPFQCAGTPIRYSLFTGVAR